MGWGCYKHEWDAASEEWAERESKLCVRKLKEKHLTFGRDGRICPACYEELERSAAEIAALVELGDVCLRWREEERKWHKMPGMTKREMEEWEAQQSVVGGCYRDYLAALARLDASRKEQGK